MDFFSTIAGKRFTEHTIPQLTKAMNRLAAAMEKQNELMEMEGKIDLEKKEEEENEKNT